MPKGQKKQDKANAEALAEQRANKIASDYEEYKERIDERIEHGEKIELKPLEKWIRKVTKKNTDGTEETIEVSGDSGETRSEKFKRLVEKRMVKALDDLDLIMNLSTPQYESTEKQQLQVVNALRLKVLDIENSFKAQTKLTEPAFSL